MTADDEEGDRMGERANQLKNVQAMSQSFLQMVIQIYLFVMLALMGGATMIAGVDAATFFSRICESDKHTPFSDKTLPITLLSICHRYFNGDHNSGVNSQFGRVGLDEPLLRLEESGRRRRNLDQL